MSRIAVLLSLVCLSPVLAADLAAQTVSGRVIDALTRTPVAGAIVSLSSMDTRATDDRGEFRFRNVPRGRSAIRVEALGYVTVVDSLNVVQDTAVTVLLDPDPVRGDTLRARAGFVTVTGRLTDAQTGRSVSDGDVYASRSRTTRSSLTGRFVFARVPASVPFEMMVLAFGYRPMRIVMEPNRDTTVAVALEIDSLQQRLIKQQLQRLQTRMDNAVGRAYAVSRDEMLQRENMTLWHALYHTGHGIVHRLPPMRLDTVPQCVFVDEREVRTPAFNDQGRIIPGVSGAAQFLFPEDVERVEFYAEGAMVRIYTRRYMARLVSGDVRLTTPSFAQPPRGLSRTASEPICG